MPRTASKTESAKPEAAETEPKTDLPETEPKTDLPETEPKTDLPETEPKTDLPEAGLDDAGDTDTNDGKPQPPNVSEPGPSDLLERGIEAIRTASALFAQARSGNAAADSHIATVQQRLTLATGNAEAAAKILA